MKYEYTEQIVTALRDHKGIHGIVARALLDLADQRDALVTACESWLKAADHGDYHDAIVAGMAIRDAVAKVKGTE